MHDNYDLFVAMIFIFLSQKGFANNIYRLPPNYEVY